MRKIRVAIVGVGNCAKSLVEGVFVYKKTGVLLGLTHESIGGFLPSDLEFVLGVDVDERKVGKSINEAIYEEPNCALHLANPDEVVSEKGCGKVHRGPVLDGVASHMLTGPDNRRFALSLVVDNPHETIDKLLANSAIDVALIYLPVGSAAATQFYVELFLKHRIPFVNCIPEFIVSSPVWAERIRLAGIPAVGDDMRSQVGASVLSQVLQSMFLTRGAKIGFHCQTNLGGNTDFRNMSDKSRLVSKKKSKENVIRGESERHGVTPTTDEVHAGPSDYIPHMGDRKVAHVRIEAEGFGGAKIELDCKLVVEDSPNSAGVVIDAVRCVHVAKMLGMVGPLEGVSAFTQKSPPRQMSLEQAKAEVDLLANVKGLL